MPSVSALYRPQTFKDVTGQDHVTETLRLEIESGKVGHAYLFSGPRGVGKTTAARIFAKALNCLHPKNGEPDNACDSCLDADAGKSLDVIEMDAATHNGVDNVREAIIEHVRYAPRRKHKIYILDEAHMITVPAWNALLKTIEEPPDYAVFLFLTTELHKVPATIQSRCQRFDFKRIEGKKLESRILNLAEREGVKIAPEVVKTLVAKSDGCLRDAESFLGQLLVLGEKNITADAASLVLPVSRLPIAADLLATWSRREPGSAFAQIEELETQGIAMLPLFDDLVDAVRLLLLSADSVTMRQKLANGDDGEKKLATLVTTYESAELSEMALMLMERRRDAKQGADARFCVELAACAVCLSLLPHASSRELSLPPPRLPTPDERVGIGGQVVKMGNPTVTPTPGSVMPAKAGIQDAQHTSTLDSRFRGNDNNDAPSLSVIQSKWAAFLRLMDEKSKSLTFVLKITRPTAVNGATVILEFKYQFHMEKILSDMKSKRLVEDALREATGISNLCIDGVVSNEEAAAGGDVSATTHVERDMVSNILNAFGGHVVEEGAGAGEGM